MTLAAAAQRLSRNPLFDERLGQFLPDPTGPFEGGPSVHDEASSNAHFSGMCEIKLRDQRSEASTCYWSASSATPLVVIVMHALCPLSSSIHSLMSCAHMLATEAGRAVQGWQSDNTMPMSTPAIIAWVPLPPDPHRACRPEAACRGLAHPATSYIDHYPGHLVELVEKHQAANPTSLPFNANSEYSREFGYKEGSPRARNAGSSPSVVVPRTPFMVPF
jgi:hypothetical protein